ncbi:MAG: hypothetical protein NZ901_08580 [Geminocystis sp.]|nr:hypothetical protein [Geminocystis sp.]HIK37273.1 hypothetical protein [Geminocystis sp. M7585_C2015_104]MCS7148230.1 hypothetical protein [Geminocystis sp.]MCX8077644.1 hypothetical protein [Geminocystis sp.]MDW8116536.1 hypothetical protein [Geminocystis sp.]
MNLWFRRWTRGGLLLAVVFLAMCYPELWRVGMAGVMGFFFAYLLAKGVRV